MDKIIELKKVTKRFHQQEVVSSVSFSLAPGEVFGLLGPNGAGKTTLLRMIMGIFYPDEGEVRLFGEKFTPELRKKIGYLPEERGLYLKQKIMDMLLYFARLKGLKEEEGRSRVRAYLEEVGLSDCENRTAESLSKGMQQKIQLILALLGSPRVLLLDEPFSGLDPVNIRMVKNMLLKRKEEGIPVILSSHQMNFVEELCDTVLLIHHGRPVLHNSLKEIQKSYSEHAVVIETAVALSEMASAASVEPLGARQKVTLKDEVTPQQFLKEVVALGDVYFFEVYHTPLEDIFISVVSNELTPIKEENK